MLTKTYIREIIDRLEKATPGPWISFLEKRDKFSGSNFIRTGGEDIYLLGATEEDQEFVAHARQDIQSLVSEVLRLQLLIPNDKGLE